MRTLVLMPDPFASAVLKRVLAAQADMDSVPDCAAGCDIVLVHGSLVESRLARLSAIAASGKRVIVTCASPRPDDLARYLAAGARGYHRAGEPLAKLLGVIREVHAGGMRYDPFVMACVLRNFHDLRNGAGKKRVPSV
jgi:DNA-binding NarL/FixJ family response regulator